MEQNKTYEIKGLHCKSCAMMTEEVLSELDWIDSVKVTDDLKKVGLKLSASAPADPAKVINQALKEHGYSVA